MLPTSTRNGLVALSRRQRPVARLHQSCASSRIGLPASGFLCSRHYTGTAAAAAAAGQQQSSQAPSPAQPPKQKKKKAGFFRWTYRVVMLSVAAGTGALGYGIYNARHPYDQVDPDPSKKTLVIW
ncbi:NADH:ubiquinone oxidoreductase, partial [Ascosphaera pollenicola]